MSSTSENDTSIIIRRALSSDAEQCNAFHNEIYRDDRSVEGWLWEFSKVRNSRDELPFLYVEKDGAIVGTQAYIEIEFIDSKGTYRTGKSEETLVHPQLRGQRLFGRLYEELFCIAEENELHGLWGFTPAGKAFRRVGFETPSHVTQLLKPLSYRFFSEMSAASKNDTPEIKESPFKRLIKNCAGCVVLLISSLRWPVKALKDIEILQLKSAPDWADELSENFISQWGGTSIHRSKKYVEWRFFQNPYCDTEVWGVFSAKRPIGLFVTATHNNILYLVDILAAPITNNKSTNSDLQLLTTMLSKVEQIAKEKKLLGIRAWHGSEHNFSKLLNRAAKKLGWFHYKKGNEVVIWRNEEISKNRLPSSLDEIFITRAFTEGHMG